MNGGTLKNFKMRNEIIGRNEEFSEVLGCDNCAGNEIRIKLDESMADRQKCRPTRLCPRWKWYSVSAFPAGPPHVRTGRREGGARHLHNKSNYQIIIHDSRKNTQINRNH